VTAGPTGQADRVSVTHAERLWFGPHDPVRAASAVARLGDGWLIAQDDAVHGGWWREPFSQVDRIRFLDPREGLDTFSEAAGTKRLKPDLEAACPVQTDDVAGVLLLGSGSLPNRMTGVLVELVGDEVRVQAQDLTALYHEVAEILEVDGSQLNLEGACVLTGRLRWFQRGHAGSGVPSTSVDLDLSAVVAAVQGRRPSGTVEVGGVRRYDLGCMDGLPLAITDAVALPDGRVCASAAAEDTTDPVADGPVAGSALALLGTDGDVEVVPLPPDVASHKVEGLAIEGVDGTVVRLLAVVDDDDPAVASTAFHLSLQTGPGSPRRD
jgi:hypothetical protein